MSVNLLKPSSIAGALIHSDSDIASSGTKKFWMKVVQFSLESRNKPIDLTSETDEFPDIRHLNFLEGSFRLTGFVTRDKQPSFDTLRSSTNNHQLELKLYVGSDQQSSEKKYYWNFKFVLNRITTQFVQTAPATQISMDGLITHYVQDGLSNKYSIYEEMVS